ncbi:hypothetical protein GVO57_14480 (plasmid) [Sphingomonas changnyeongensis]|uniref:Uncharacterized protein n=1 Tax=Sphingomonas changnyeongensis TaxID=2698679 RepID=A0A7Z2NZ60_9SPHN|nr:hypothetical protein [Sphingomonas changnyeongensis]QHL92079.1 hypothetical protein GVO57_14480 [Sphingomonas changnyeongensis]
MTDLSGTNQGEPAMIEAPEIPHTAHSHDHGSSGRRWFDIAMAVAVLLVSTGSLYVSLHTGHTMEALVKANERLVKAQSTPVLQYDHGNVSDTGRKELAFTLTNVGSGPARVVWFEVAPAGQRYSNIGEWVMASGKSSITFTSATINQIVLAPNDKRNLLVWPRPDDEAGLKRWNRIDRERFKTSVRACYCSVFDQCWQSSLEADIPKEVASCERNDLNSSRQTIPS